MKFAEVEGSRRGASPGLSGKCCVCGSVALAKCGQLRAWHWSHRNLSACDHWWEPETEWHRNWKNQFVEENQEIIQLSADGEKHVADVKTPSGLVIEFQHSHLHPDERRAREFAAHFVSMPIERPADRDFADLAAILAAGLQRLSERKSSQKSCSIAETPLDCRAPSRGHVRKKAEDEAA